MQFPFFKYVGSGNDFILFDNRNDHFPISERSTLIKKICHRHYGIGADGVILLEDSEIADFRMRIFNADGNEAEMCGNGVRCCTQFLISLGFRLPSFSIELQHRIIKSWVIENENHITIEIGTIDNIAWNVSIPMQQTSQAIHCLNTGVPHAVTFVENIDSFDIEGWGKKIRHHPHWQPHGTNATIAQCIEKKKIKIRTFERGVEGETLACGTGAVAAALCAAHLYQFQSPISVQTKSREEMIVTFTPSWNEVRLTGPATFVYQGEINLKNLPNLSTE